MPTETTQQFLSFYIREVLAGSAGIVAAIEDLTSEQLQFRPHDGANSVGFDAWHVFRTADNIVQFVFYHEEPIWLQQGLDVAWGLPRLAQGTGMESSRGACAAVPGAGIAGAIWPGCCGNRVSHIENMTDEFLAETTRIRPHGELTRLHALGTTILAHSYAHLGQINLARTLLAMPSLDF